MPCLIALRATEIDGDADLRRWEGAEELPCLDNRPYRRRLRLHVNQQPFPRQVLLVYGPKSVGKSRILLEEIEKWRGEGHLVVDINLKGVPIDSEKLPQLFWCCYFEAKARQDPKFQVEQALRVAAESLRSVNIPPTKEGRGRAEEAGSFFHAVAKPSTDWKGKVWKALTRFVHSLPESALEAFLARKVFEIMQPAETEHPTIFPYTALLQRLEEDSRKGNKKPAILVLRSVEKLLAEKEIFDALFTNFETRQEGASVVPVVVESSESLHEHLESTISSSSESFKPFLVSELSREQMWKDLVPSIFTADEFEKVFGLVGGHLGQLFDLHVDLRGGMTLDEALRAKLRECVQRLRVVLNRLEGPDYHQIGRKGLQKEGEEEEGGQLDLKGRGIEDRLWYCRLEVLRLLSESGYEIHPDELRKRGLRKSLLCLCKKKVLWEEENRVVPHQSVMRAAIQRILLLEGQTLGSSVTDSVKSEPAPNPEADHQLLHPNLLIARHDEQMDSRNWEGDVGHKVKRRRGPTKASMEKDRDAFASQKSLSDS
uniref:Orc1-like AAA ATPase domain-containing protein n=1 Tax=Chromera velia CCMP2878 TaxID=1169474 RepID=A0A0G4FTY6_9ALVE|eukprot:Cvel_18784.t1-p1 / transcript=Cvel_18784.t1 / gene=Cvel_18784 / organism=Chromera_velia_CCMP2878 / gene_product=hypothetical protein / transcript_product=hypothetical protein / location=Cvel_scaffold1577:3586-5208(+) / protein_length=541 / sequence_SO=supercontig / SO=protein_coding / is_pseudo=false